MIKKQKMFFWILVGLFIMVGSTQSHSSTYYVSVSGSDTNTGSREFPFATIQQALEHVQIGGTVTVLEGIYAETITLDTESITLTTEGAVTLLPSPMTADDQATLTISASNVTISGFIFEGHEIAIETQAHGTHLANMTVREGETAVNLRDVRNVSIRDSHFENNRVVDVYLNGVDGLTISDSIFLNDGSFGDARVGDFRRSSAISSFFSNQPINNVVMDGIHVIGYSYYGIDIRTRTVDDRIFWAHDIQLLNSVIANNGTASEPDENGIAEYNFGGILWQGVDGGAIVNNRIERNIGWGMDCYVCNNILYANNLFLFNAPQEAGQVGPGVGLEVNAGYSNLVVHNVFYGNDTGLFSSFLVNPGDGGPSSVAILNNIIAGNTDIDGDYEAFGGGDEAEFPFVRTIQGNIFGEVGFGANRDTLAEDNFFDVAILFLDASAEDFRLDAQSPAIDGGVLTNLDFDHDMRARPIGNAPDIGAFETGSTTAAALIFSIPSGTPPIHQTENVMPTEESTMNEHEEAQGDNDNLIDDGEALTDAELFEWSLQVDQYTDAQLAQIGFGPPDIARMRFFAENPEAYQPQEESHSGNAVTNAPSIPMEDAVGIAEHEAALAAITAIPAELIDQIPVVERYPATVERFIQVDDEIRRFLVYLPSADTNRPVVFSLHGWGFPPEDMQAWTQWEDLAQQNNIIVVYPEARVPELLWQFSADVPFFEAMLDIAQRDYDTDPTRVYVSGFSSGGFMAHFLGAALSERITAVASINGLVPDVEQEIPPTPQRPVSVAMIHNIQDAIIPYEDVADSINTWLVWNSCATSPQQRQYSDQVTWAIYAECDDGVRVELFTFDSTEFDGHFIPWENQGINAAEALWMFFNQFVHENQ